MNFHKIVLLVSLVFSSAFVVKAQDDEDDDNFKMDPKFSLNVNISLPNSIANKPFNSIMKGLVNADLHFKYATKFGLYAGVGYRYLYFDINEFRTPYRVYGGMHSHAPFVNIGFEKYLTQRFGIDVHTKVGMSINRFFSDTLKRSGVKYVNDQSLYIEPVIGLILATSEHHAYRLNIGYAIQGFGFTLDKIGVMESGGFDAAEGKRVSQYFNIGFGYTYYFTSKKKR